MANRKKPQRAYTLLIEGYKGSGWEPRFAFHAHNKADALSKAKGWMRYHGYDPREVKVRGATKNEAKNWLHNEWVK